MTKLVLLVVGLLIAAMSVVQLDLVAKEPEKKSATEVTEGTEIEWLDFQPAPSEPPAAANGEKAADEDPPLGRLVIPDQLEQAKIPEGAGLEALQEQMLTQAARAYKAHLAAFRAQTTTMPSVYNWSLRWMQVAESAAKNQAERIAAARKHVERMAELQKCIEGLFKVGTRGVEAADYAAANFYLAEAKRHLAELEAAAQTSAVRESTDKLDIVDIVKGPRNVATVGNYNEFALRKEGLEHQLKQIETTLKRSSLSEQERRKAEATRQSLIKAINARSRPDAIYLGAAMPNGYLASQPAPLVSATEARNTADHQLQLVDLEIRLAELRGQYRQTELEFKIAEAKVSSARRWNEQEPGSVSSTSLTRALEEFERLKAPLESLKEQITLNERKFALLKSLAKPQPQIDDDARGPASRARPPGDATAKPVLHYAGKDFDAWRAILRNDLDPATRTEAVRAVAAFANHGYGRAAAEAIVEIFKDFKPVPYDGGPMGNLRETALKAFSPHNYGAMMQIPIEDALPVILDASQSDIADQRLFAVLALQSLTDDATLVLPLMVEKLADPAPEVRRNAAVYLVMSHPDTPGLLEVMREWLSPKEDRFTSQMAIVTLNQAAPELQAKLAPELVRLLDREIEMGRVGGEGGMGGMPFEIANHQNAGPLLLRLGPAAIPALEEGAKSDDDVVRNKSTQLLETLRTQADKPPAE